MKPENGFIHDTSQQKHLVNFLSFGNSSEFVVESDSYFGFQEFFLLFSGCHILFVSKLMTLVKIRNEDLEMQF